MSRNFVILFFLLICFCSPLKALDFQVPEDIENTEISLITIGLGAELHERYGHTVMRIRDWSRGREYNVNWGIFDFADPEFPYKFYKGHLDYMMGFNSYASLVRIYEHTERSMVEQVMNLTRNQKQKLLERIEWNARPENRGYRYQYFFDNCSTRPRDYIDEALNGALKSFYKGKWIEKVHRNFVYENLNKPPPIAFSLDITMNSRIDRPVDEWDAMFLPSILMENLTKFPALDDAGVPISGLNLLSEPEVIVEGREHPSSIIDSYHILTAFFIILLIPAGLMIGQFHPAKHQITKKISYGYRKLGLATTFWGLLAWVFGFLMALSWMISDHLDLHHNANLLLFWPTDFVFIFIGPYLTFKGKAMVFSEKWTRFLKYYFELHLVCAVILAIGYMTGWIEQNVSRIVTTLVPIHLLLVVMMKQKALLNPNTSSAAHDLES